MLEKLYFQGDNFQITFSPQSTLLIENKFPTKLMSKDTSYDFSHDPDLRGILWGNVNKYKLTYSTHEIL